MWADGGQRGSSIYEGGGGGSAEGPEQSSPEEAQDPGQASSVLQMAPSGFYPRPFWDGSHVHRTEPGLQALETGHAVTTPHLCHEHSLRFAPAVACEPGTYFSGESGQCVPCTPGTYQDEDGQLSCTPCPSSDGLGLAGARNVSECGGKCGPSLEGRRGGDAVPPGSTEAPRAPAQSPTALCEARHRVPGGPRPPAATPAERPADTQRPRDREPRSRQRWAALTPHAVWGGFAVYGPVTTYGSTCGL